MSTEPIFVDTWGWLVLGDGKHERHADATALFQDLDRDHVPRHTTDYVLDELITVLFRDGAADHAATFLKGVFDSSDDGHLHIHRVTSARFEAAWQLRLRHRGEAALTFTDLTSLAVIDELGLERVMTDDQRLVDAGTELERVP